MIVFSHPTGNANVRHSVRALADAQLLAEFWTTINWQPDLALSRIAPESLRRQLERRSYDADLAARTHTDPLLECARLLAPRMKLGRLTRHEVGMLSVDAIYHHLDKRVARRLAQVKGATGVYAYEDGAAETFAAAHRLGMTCIYDQPIGYWRAGQKIYSEEREREPEWSATLAGARDSEAKLSRKDAELQQADTVICASTFTQSTLALGPELRGPVYTIPYGAPAPIAPADVNVTRGRKLRVLFVGSLTQRKGMSYLLAAVEALGSSVELTLIGKRPAVDCAPLDAAIQRHRWISSLPHDGILREMHAHDVLVFPSLFEGFGLVLLEALSQGIPIITTPHTGGPDIVTDGVEGFIVPIRSSTAIAERLLALAADHERLVVMKRAARDRAEEQPWSRFHTAAAQAVRTALSAGNGHSDTRTAEGVNGPLRSTEPQSVAR